MSKRLELIWPNKDKVLLGLDENGKPRWGTKEDLEPGPLVQLEAVGETNRDNPNDLYEQGDNLLIKGDNLLALKALEPHFTGKIKCIYIDPPFNTGNAFEHYDDGLEHTIWLSMMKARLEILRKLLREDDGIIAVHIDERELAYLRILLDEIFGRNNFIRQIVVKAKAAAGVGQESFVFDICEYLLLYGRDSTFAENYMPRVVQPFDGWEETAFDLIFLNEGKREHVNDILGGQVGKVSVFVHSDFQVRRLSSSEHNENFFKRHLEQVFQTTNPQGGLMKRIMPQLPEKELVSIDYVPTRGRYVGKKVTIFFYRGRIVSWLKDIANVNSENGRLDRKTKLVNIWEENLYQGISYEGGIYFPQSKKPERLIQRIIEMTTKPTDWVLDSFLGSGTTAAVAHKLCRKWIGIESGEHAETLCLPRLKRVVSGKDPTGISKQASWKGGGGFRYCVLGEKPL
ncbi:MAG TPA: site-specific DNA-methyltransferase [Candidatus Brocadiia bacterium]|nr:site-specific DNA-methyltransferase [Candidatus Brocadiales bacterium]